MHSTCRVNGGGAGFSPLTTDWMYTAVVAASWLRGSSGRLEAPATTATIEKKIRARVESLSTRERGLVRAVMSPGTAVIQTP